MCIAPGLDLVAMTAVVANSGTLPPFVTLTGERESINFQTRFTGNQYEVKNYLKNLSLFTGLLPKETQSQQSNKAKISY